MEDYEKECEKRKARAEKFGTTYVPPKLEDYLPWTEVKRLREEPKIAGKGFATGIDLMDSEELAKQEARKARFAKMASANEVENKVSDEAATTTLENETAKAPNDEAPPSAKQTDDLPVTQCWDKEEMLRPQRSDPPSTMWLKPAKPENEERETTPTDEAVWVPEKIHLFAIDWAAFKQIRNKDLMAFFTGYGPTYVEWLGDLSCNVCFEDQFTAKRALMNLGQEIPSPPPEEVSTPEGEAPREVPDFGCMTWRFCKKPVRKIANDRHGRKGTTARILMRSALSTDILQDRPNSWPAPPGGFSSTEVLGPDSDYKGGKKKGKKKRQREAKPKEQRDVYVPHVDPDGEHPMLVRGLASGREGFSLEEMEQERARKRTKTTESSSS